MRDVYLVKGVRAPQAKSGTKLKDVAAPYLGHYLIRYLCDLYGIKKDDVDEVIVGNTGNPVNFPNVGRVMALEAGLDKKTSGVTVHRNCASGMEAMSQAFYKIGSGAMDIVFAGGVENMSQMPLLLTDQMREFFMSFVSAKTPMDRLKLMSTLPWNHLKPIIAIEKGLTDPFCGLNMGQTAEKLAREFSISRQEQDEFANNSHLKYFAAKEQGVWSEEIVPLMIGSRTDHLLLEDVGPRSGSTLESLAKLKPFFERETGTVTVGNACPITDGGSMWLMCSKEAVDRYNLKPEAKLKAIHFHGLEPERMGLGPSLAISELLRKQKMKSSDIDLFEINEAFAAQVLACLKVMDSDYLSKHHGLESSGKIDMEKLNIFGGAIALGHPVGSTGSRLVVTLVNALKRRDKTFGVASLCIGGGQGGAVLVERLK